MKWGVLASARWPLWGEGRGSFGTLPCGDEPYRPSTGCSDTPAWLLSASGLSPGGGRGILAYLPQSLPWPAPPIRGTQKGGCPVAPPPSSASPTSTAEQRPWAARPRPGWGAAACRRVALTSPRSLGEALPSGPRSASQPSLENTQDTMARIPVVALPLCSLFPPSSQPVLGAVDRISASSLSPPWASTSSGDTALPVPDPECPPPGPPQDPGSQSLWRQEASGRPRFK